jgi:RNA polymerase sigma-70 factor (ECF subfamily)
MSGVHRGVRATTAPADGAESSELLAELAGDLDQGFTALYQAHRQVVFSTALRVSGRWADAEDLTAEAFLRAYRALRGYRRDRIMALRPRPWLVTILLNIWRNDQRTRGRRPAEAPLAAGAGAADDADGPQALAEGRETRRELAGLLLELPEQQRVAVVLRHVSGLTLAEISAVLGTGEGTVKSHISRGLSKLRALDPAGGRAVGGTRAPVGGAGR